MLVPGHGHLVIDTTSSDLFHYFQRSEDHVDDDMLPLFGEGSLRHDSRRDPEVRMFEWDENGTRKGN
jgi:hypothetical protein